MSGSLTVGLLAHVDAGKTTLSEAMLYQSGTLRRLGNSTPSLSRRAGTQ